MNRYVSGQPLFDVFSRTPDTFWVHRSISNVRRYGTLMPPTNRDGNGSVGHGSNGSPFLDGSHGSWVTAIDPLTHDDEITDRNSLQF